jgi:glucose/arabinose dehydrogenase
MRRTWVACALAICGAVAACGGNGPPAPSPGGGDTGTITGRERLAWDQLAQSDAELATFRYALYVDGNRTELPNASCTFGPGTVYVCTAQLPSMAPGRHTLELATYIDGAPSLESARSSPLVVTVAGAATSGLPSSPSTNALSSSPQLATSAGVRLFVEAFADGLEQSTAIEFAPDGGMFVAERAGRIRIVRDGALRPEPALTLDHLFVADDNGADDNGGLLDLALDPDFRQNRLVFVLDVVADDAGAPVFRLARYREAADRFGERAILFDNVPASASHPSGSIAFGPDGKLYVALDDADDPVNAARLSSFNGKVLRLNADGSTPDDQPAASPVYSSGHRSPRSLSWDSQTGALWLADPVRSDAERLNATASEAARAERVVRTAFSLPLSTGPTAVTIYRGELIGALRGDLLAASDREGSILRVRFDGSLQRVASTERLDLDGADHVHTIRVGPDGAVYVGTDHGVLRIAPKAQF